MLYYGFYLMQVERVWDEVGKKTEREPVLAKHHFPNEKLKLEKTNQNIIN